MLTISLLTVLGVGCLLLLWILLSWLRDPLRDVPGPLLTRFTRLWHVYHFYSGDFQRVNIALHDKYGPVVRIAPGWYSIKSTEAAMLIYGHGKGFEKSKWFYGFQTPEPGKSTLFTERDKRVHAQMRRNVGSAYSMTSLVEYEPFVQNCVDILRTRFEEMADANTTADLGWWLQCFAFDVIGEITFAKRFGFLDAGKDIATMISSVNNTFNYGGFIGMFNDWHPFLFKWVNKLFSSRMIGLKYNINFTEDAMRERQAAMDRKLEGGPPDFLSKFLQMHMEKPESFSKYAVLNGCLSNVVAGSETSSVTITSIIHNLFKHPEALEKLRKELNENPSRSFHDAQKLPYLQAVIKESMRVHPAGGSPMWRTVSEGGVEIDSRYFPEGINVGMSPWVTHRNQAIWGPDADDFRPERWLEASPEQMRAMDRNYLAFGMGSRTCMGRHISLLEMNKVVPVLVSEFDFDFVHPGKEVRTLTRTLVKQLDMDCRIKRRNCE